MLLYLVMALKYLTKQVVMRISHCVIFSDKDKVRRVRDRYINNTKFFHNLLV